MNCSNISLVCHFGYTGMCRCENGTFFKQFSLREGYSNPRILAKDRVLWQLKLESAKAANSLSAGLIETKLNYHKKNWLTRGFPLTTHVVVRHYRVWSRLGIFGVQSKINSGLGIPMNIACCKAWVSELH